jgi:hypothetical protein
MWGGFFLLCSTSAVAAFLVSHKLSRPFRRLGLYFGFLLSALAIPTGLIAAFEAVMCSSETTGQGVLSEQGLVWSIERQGCGATTAGIYTVRLGPRAWWSHRILTADAFRFLAPSGRRERVPCGSSSIPIVQARTDQQLD